MPRFPLKHLDLYKHTGTRQGLQIKQEDSKFGVGLLANNGTIYFIPGFSKKILKFDPQNSSNLLTEIRDDLGDGREKMWGGVLGGDGNIYGIPHDFNQVLKINVADDSTTFIGDEHPSGSWVLEYWQKMATSMPVQTLQTKYFRSIYHFRSSAAAGRYTLEQRN